MKKQIINIINFVRGTEPRLYIDLLGTFEKQLAALRREGLRATILFQYDAMCDERFVAALKPYRDIVEVGLWIELVRTCIEKAGEEWRGNPDWEWDWHGNICNTVGYTPDARRRIADECMDKFKSVFGYYPASVGAWAIDAVTLAHLNDKYNISAACNCKEQWGTDGYTLWGGYYGQGYYPSRNNSLCPAQTLSNQINTPVFRMLGSDPIYQYDAGLNISSNAADAQPVVTLEPVYTGVEGGGGVPKWVDWYLSENFNGKCLSFGYTQAGQENSFGWERLSDGYLYQLSKIKELSSTGKLEVMTLGETGEWYKSNYPITPSSSIVAESDWMGQGRKSYWYCSHRYRANLFFDDKAFWIRDIFLFDENYSERYLGGVCKTEGYVFDTLPVMDGNRFSGDGVRAGFYPYNTRTGKPVIMAGESHCEEHGGNMTVIISTQDYGKIVVSLTAESIAITVERNQADFALQGRVNRSSLNVECAAEGKILKYIYNGFSYQVNLSDGHLVDNSGHWLEIKPQESVITFGF